MKQSVVTKMTDQKNTLNLSTFHSLDSSEGYLRPCKISTMEFFCKNSQRQKAKVFIIDVWQSSKYAFALGVL